MRKLSCVDWLFPPPLFWVFSPTSSGLPIHKDDPPLPSIGLPNGSPSKSVAPPPTPPPPLPTPNNNTSPLALDVCSRSSVPELDEARSSLAGPSSPEMLPPLSQCSSPTRRPAAVPLGARSSSTEAPVDAPLDVRSSSGKSCPAASPVRVGTPAFASSSPPNTELTMVPLVDSERVARSGGTPSWRLASGAAAVS